MTKEIEYANRFKKDFKKLKKQGKDLDKLREIVEMLANDLEIPKKHKAHLLVGNWAGYSELHITPDWLLIYEVTEDEVYLARSGSHSELFG